MSTAVKKKPAAKPAIQEPTFGHRQAVANPALLKNIKHAAPIVRELFINPEVNIPATIQLLGGLLIIRVAGYDTGLELAVPASEARWPSPEEGDWKAPVYVDAAQLLKVASKLNPAAPVRLIAGETLATDLTITQGDLTWTVDHGNHELVHDGWPWPVDTDAEPFADIDMPHVFWPSVLALSALAGTDDTLPVLTCVRFAQTGGRHITCMVTDRYRAADQMFLTRGPVGSEKTVLVPAKAIQAAAKLAAALPHQSVAMRTRSTGEAEFSMNLGLGDQVVTVARIYTRGMDGSFPKAEALFEGDPTTPGYSIRVLDCKRLEAALKIAEPTSMYVLLSSENGRLEVTSEDGRFRQVIGDAQLGEGSMTKVKVNPRYLRECLALFNDPALGVEIKSLTEEIRRPLYLSERSEVWADVAVHPPRCLLMPVRAGD